MFVKDGFEALGEAIGVETEEEQFDSSDERDKRSPGMENGSIGSLGESENKVTTTGDFSKPSKDFLLHRELRSINSLGMYPCFVSSQTGRTRSHFSHGSARAVTRSPLDTESSEGLCPLKS